ncbi:MAG: 23S rRNA (adenine(2503)-C(2))-methyltransferase RlmN [Alphaproteobacteria bacterium]|nr:23S rRNA (adenine(2503)-C(2))-methyltransferase RlmN [Alphaproteobacteria bacterium]
MDTHNIEGHAARFAPPQAPQDGPLNLVGLTLEEIQKAIKALDLESFRAKQIWTALYCHGLRDFEQMTTLARPVRQKLADHFFIGRPEIKAMQKSVDGSCKWLLAMEDGHEIEMVYIPEEDRGALCVSCQVGCTNSCTFCHTGTMRLVRNLSAAEIVMQVMIARDELKDWKVPALEKRKLSNLVLMGMGEPLFNYDNVAKALKIIMNDSGLALGRRKITLSTSGVVPMMERCGRELGVNLAISLHAVSDEVRSRLVPLNKKYPIKDLLQACRNYPAASNARRITFEYVMLKGINDSMEDARALVKLLRGIPAKINLLPYNNWPGSPYEGSDEKTMQTFGDYLNAQGYASPVRSPRGRDIMAACGQLKSASVRSPLLSSSGNREAVEPGI